MPGKQQTPGTSCVRWTVSPPAAATRCRSLSSDALCSSLSMSGAPFRRYSTVRESPTLATWSVVADEQADGGARARPHEVGAAAGAALGVARRVVREQLRVRLGEDGGERRRRVALEARVADEVLVQVRFEPERRRLAAEAVVHRPERAAHVAPDRRREVGDELVEVVELDEGVLLLPAVADVLLAAAGVRHVGCGWC